MAIQVSSLTKRYGKTVALKDLSLEVVSGEVFGILGPNGAGKTTLIEILEGYRHADSGEVNVLGLDPNRQARTLKQKVGLMLQEGGLHPGLRVEEILHLYASFYDSPMERVGLMNRLGLEKRARAKVKTLSGGEKQRLSFAVAVIGRPELLFLDEPTSGTDPGGKNEIWTMIQEINAGGTTVILTTHNMDEAQRLSDRVALIHDGTLMALGPPTELFSGQGLQITCERPIDREKMARDLQLTISEVSPGTYAISDPASPQLIARVTAWLSHRGVLLTELTSRGSLEAVFLALTSDEDSL